MRLLHLHTLTVLLTPAWRIAPPIAILVLRKRLACPSRDTSTRLCSPQELLRDHLATAVVPFNCQMDVQKEWGTAGT